MSDPINTVCEIGEINITLNPFRLGEIFANMDSQDQARFLKGFASNADSFGYKWDIQASYIADEFKDKPAFSVCVIDALSSIIEHLKEIK